MADDHTLYIITSNEFRTYFLRERMNETIAFVGSTLVGIEEPPAGNLWDEAFHGRVLKKIEEHRGRVGLCVRFAGHFRTCFGDRVAEGVQIGAMRDRPFPDKAEALKAAAGGDVDVQVWGFSHSKDLSTIWAVLSADKSVYQPSTIEEAKLEFEQRLLSAFAQAMIHDEAAAEGEGDWTRREHLSVISHDIMGQFNPLRLDLDTAVYREAEAARSDDQEFRNWAREKVGTLHAEVVELLPAKLKVAHAKLEQARELVSGEEQKAAWKNVAAKLDEMKPAELEGRLAEVQPKFRSWADELHGLLRKLTR